MMEKAILLEKSRLGDFLEKLSADYDVYVPVKKGEQRFYKRHTATGNDPVLGEVRPFEPLKAFFTRCREKVANGFKPDIPHESDKSFAIVGVKACDLKGFKVQDHVFRDHDFPDAFYIKNREKNFIVSADCTCTIETCFCTALGIGPHPTDDFDINLSVIEAGFLADPGSEKGRGFIRKNPSLFVPATDAQLRAKEAQREKIHREVDGNVSRNEVPKQDHFQGMIERNFNADLWADEAKTCVECGACTVICPTCHCFLLYDQMDGEKMARLRIWDSCMLKRYARVAGGSNPRGKLFMRLRNRFEKKFDFFPKIMNVYACTGCGRCVSACPAKIDIRKVLKRLVNHA